MRKRLAARALVGVVIFVATGAAAQTQQPDAEAAGRGENAYKRFCAVCHGTELRGDGPLANELRRKVKDLTTLAADNSGQFPFDRTVRRIDGREKVGGHGTSDMPAWGDALSKSEGRDAPTPEQAIANLTHYIWSKQQGGAKK